jgi:hypothetical protein
LEREEQPYEAQPSALRAAIDDGDASGVADGNPFARIRETLNLPSAIGVRPVLSPKGDRK